jgi:hypothetical protein
MAISAEQRMFSKHKLHAIAQQKADWVRKCQEEGDEHLLQQSECERQKRLP